jgi:serine/threonine protein kinase
MRASTAELPVAAITPGAELAGYRIESVLGEGGMGIVYLATQLKLGRRVALKVLAPELAGDEEFRQRFVRESNAAAALDDPNVLPIYDADEADGHLYMAMRYIDGADLGRILDERGRLGERQALALVEQMGGALDAAHRAGLVHHDVKPANILIDRRGVAYLCDFGLARSSVAGEDGAPGYFLGTVSYCAPEQVAGRRTDWRTDLYALGAVAFHALSGKLPFDRRTDAEIARAHLDDPVPKGTGHNAVDAVLATALAKDPDSRYQTGGAFADALADALEEEPTRPVPVTETSAQKTTGGRLTEEAFRAGLEKSRGPLFKRTPPDRRTRVQKVADPKRAGPLTDEVLRERLGSGRGPLRWHELKHPSPPTRLQKVQKQQQHDTGGRLTDDVLRAKVEEERQRRARRAD